ncbi:ATP-binding protein [Herbiconiux moechotypicola]|uniref:Helicase HerA central domain-containing protein n=1 Tax=Herbiconiux moechotypicola TaxID=637393 RepID=A0ABN3DME3_9MICO|nr:ATP-binding protein [Herbiconiux moechotypicola]MCS5730238.1 ATP-binding protein [Herbiconiux moechotypicola]
MTGDEPSAFSLDGRLFQFEAPVQAGLGAGALVHLVDPERTQVAQIEALSTVAGDRVSGSGTILGVLVTSHELDTRRSHPFSWAAVAGATPDTSALVYGDSSTGLRMGTLLGNPSSEARVLAHRFNRHTFWCGQSGSGKTYALGVLLEQLLVHTALPLLILDPNSDFVRLREHRPGQVDEVSAADRNALAGRDIRVLRPTSDDGPDALRVRFVTLPLTAKAAVLRLDPVVDREEYGELIRTDVSSVSRESANILERLRERGTSAAHALADRIENLGVLDWSVWSYGHGTVTDIVDERPDATVLDLGGFDHPDEHLVVALAVLDDLWAKREQRRPLLIVIDEAHNLCSPDTRSPLHDAVRERIIQIAAEGRKFGLWLLLSTQRPSKIHPNVLSQCDNLALLRMSSPSDLAEIGDVFGFAPAAMLARSPRFRQGEALFAGGFVAAPTLLQVGDRLTVEGGIDVPVPRRPT